MKRKSMDILNTIINAKVGGNYIEITYNNGKGHFKIVKSAIFNYTISDFRKLVDIIKLSNDGDTLAGYINSLVRVVYEEVENTIKNTDKRNEDLIKDFTIYNNKMVKYNEVLKKWFKVEDLIKKPIESTIESNANITELKKCNVIRYIPTQLKPIWENGKTETKIGYSFEYRGLPLQVFRIDGTWENNESKSCRIFVIDPVIGLPVTQYDGMITDLEDKISQVFFKYLETLNNNAETIVQIANAFKKLKSA